MASHSRGAIIKSLLGNGLVALAKGIATLASGSGAMLSETIHSVVDTLNQAMLLVGNTRSLMKPTMRYPYGFGIEANFWGLLAAIGILVFGGGLSIEHGIAKLGGHEMPQRLGLALAILGLAFVVEGWVLVTVLRDVGRTRGDTPWREHLRKQPPGALTVILEDSAAVVGCLVAALALLLVELTQDPVWDAIGQIAIGVMLAVVGLALIWRNRGMLIGQGIEPKRVREIHTFLEDLDGVVRVTDVKTRRLGTHTFRLKAEVVFSGGHLAQRLIPEFAPRIREAADDAAVRAELGHFAEQLVQLQARHVDELEQAIRERFPDAVNIDLEPHLRDF